MRAVPVPGVRRLSRIATRTAVIRGVLAVALVALVLLVAAEGRHPGARRPTSLPVHSGDMIVLDLSASISSDTFSRIGETLRKLVATGGRYGLVVFSNVAYEALPPGTPSSALRPLIRYFTVPTQQAPGTAAGLPVNPWTLSFSSGTEISTGLDLAHRILVADHLARSRVVLISDLADDPQDIQRLNQVVVDEYGPGRGHTPLRVVALNAAPGDEAFFSRIASTAVTDAAATPAKPSPPPTIPPGTLPIALLVAILATVVLLAVHGLWAARLRWGMAGKPS
jgi:hypothetical protein